MVIATTKRYINLGAAATASVVALSLVTVLPERHESTAIRSEIAVVQLRAAASTQIIAIADAVKTLPSSTDATPSEAAIVYSAPPRASATGGTDALTALATAALALAVTPLWYIGFPITLPLSVLGGIVLNTLSAPFVAAAGFAGGQSLLGFGVQGGLLGLGAFVVGPLAVALGAISSLFAAPASSLVPAASQRPVNDASVSSPIDGSVFVSVDAATATDPDRPAAATKLDGLAKRNTRGAEQRSGLTAQRASESAAPQPSTNTAEIETAPTGTAEAAATAAPDEDPTASALTDESGNLRITTPKADPSPTGQTARSTGNKGASADSPSRQRGGKASAAGGSERGVEK